MVLIPGSRVQTALSFFAIIERVHTGMSMK